ncbi:Potassium channel subfamily member 1 [Oopsacas minuta]|uniref:Potassium channel subfamily member 1 n=1 Tax=Oopsacas minuta TaxID=111878 RepID=A0AAV7JHL1_9METZ|nr:Potassium channel subfamily member 1 [Oopsacas minuta]
MDDQNTSVEYISDNENAPQEETNSFQKSELGDLRLLAKQNKFLTLHRGHVQFHRLLRMMLSIVCCILYISQTWLSPSHYPYPSYCCGVAQYTTQPCVLDSYKNRTVGWAMKRAGCIYTNNLYKVYPDASAQYVLANSSEVSFSEYTNGQCRSYCNKGINCSNEIIQLCHCAIMCGDTLFCGIYEPEDCNGFNYLKLIFYEKPLWLYLLQIVCSLLATSYAIVRSVLLWKRGLWITKIIDGYFIIDCINGALSLSSLAYVPCFKDVYIPLFLQCFTARIIINNILYSFDVTNSPNKLLTPVIQKIIAALLGLACILFSFICLVHYLERIACPQSSHVTTLFQSLWFVVVTITTVGYGDKYPSTPLGQLAVIFLILIILLFLPQTLNDILELIDDSKQNYKFYSGRKKNKHVVLCVSKLDMTLLNDYLDEFYSQEENVSLVTVILTSQPPTPLVKIRLSSSLWKKKVLVIVGSALKQRDLERVKLELAKACILLSDRTTDDAQFSDQETILRASSIQRLAPHVNLYVHILKPENRMNVKFANQVVCEGQLKQVLMANNCIYPGLSSFVTLLLRTTSPGQAKDRASWQKLYDYGSGNEIYDIKLKDSMLFSGLAGRNFLFASVIIVRTTQVLLFAVKPANETEILLNPGRHHILQNEDILYYISQDREEEMLVEGGISDEEIGRLGKIFMPGAPGTVTKGNDTLSRVAYDSCLSDSIQIDEINVSIDQSRDMSRRENRRSLIKQRAISPEHDVEPGKVEEQPQGKLTPLLKSLTIGHNFNPIHFRSDHNTEKGLKQTDFHGRMSTMLRDSAQTFELQSLVDTEQCARNEILENFYNQDSETTNISVNQVPTYFGVKERVRHLNKEPLSLCCLQSGWKIPCHDSEFTAVKKIQQPDDVERMLFLTGYKNPLIVCASESGSQLYEFLLPLRAYHIPREELIPIVLLLPSIPDTAFLEAISWIPYIKFIIGNQDSVDDLIIAGALDAVGIIICLGDGTPELKEEGNMVDASRISTAQKMSQIFVSTKFYVELTERWSMRYLKLESGHSFHTLMPKNIRDFIHTPYFMSSQAFAPSMMDTLLYQCTQKDYILDLVCLLLGLKQTPGSGYIGKFEVTQSDIDTYQTYGRLMLSLANSTNDLPLAIYRTRIVKVKNSLEKMNYEYESTKLYLAKRARNLKIFDQIPDYPTKFEHSHILVNPPVNTPLRRKDVLLVLKVCSQEQYNIIHNFKSPTRRAFLLPRDLSGCSEDSDDEPKLAASRKRLSFKKINPGFQKKDFSKKFSVSSFRKRSHKSTYIGSRFPTEVPQRRGIYEKSHSFDIAMFERPMLEDIRRQHSLDVTCPSKNKSHFSFGRQHSLDVTRHNENKSDISSSPSDLDFIEIVDRKETCNEEVRNKPFLLKSPRAQKQPGKRQVRKTPAVKQNPPSKQFGIAGMFLKKTPKPIQMKNRRAVVNKQKPAMKRMMYANSASERPEITITSIDMETQHYSDLND